MSAPWTLEPIANDSRRRLVNRTGSVAWDLRIITAGFVILGPTGDLVIEREMVDTGDGVPVDLRYGLDWKATRPQLQIAWIPESEPGPRHYSIDLLSAA